MISYRFKKERTACLESFKYGRPSRIGSRRRPSRRCCGTCWAPSRSTKRQNQTRRCKFCLLMCYQIVFDYFMWFHPDDHHCHIWIYKKTDILSSYIFHTPKNPLKWLENVLFSLQPRTQGFVRLRESGPLRLIVLAFILSAKNHQRNVVSLKLRYVPCFTKNPKRPVSHF